ncbi:hypothetical protein YK48G_06950 [Lentilactobacillus fungorum]|uniref:Uncharacterized protein n=1 Tax=Lentilactobacillus fungorum TaxID=2201250 RepID=A0ABQ3VWJ3_9LACO|nr:hypothetical protein [Lentilactobacillus fungorum]GHP13270.1 hypothetical protein YK48G_06950 [Lentilactobacillus fungorum]
MLSNLKLHRSTYIFLLVWTLFSITFCVVTYKMQPLTVTFIKNDDRILQGLLRGVILLAVYVAFSFIPYRFAILIPNLAYFGLLVAWIWQLIFVVLGSGVVGIAADAVFVLVYGLLVYCATVTAFQIIERVRRNQSAYYFHKWLMTTKRVLVAHWLPLVVLVCAYAFLWATVSPR